MTDEKTKYTIDEVKAFSPRMLQRIIERAKKYLKSNDVMKNVLEEYDLDVSEIDVIPVMFKELDVSARTERGVVYLNYKLLCDGDFFKDYSYLVHEFTHYAQQTTGTKPTQGADEGDYLDNPYEVEGFQNQVEWIGEHFGEDEADEYVDDMLDFHGLKGKDKEEKAEELKSKL